MHLTGSAIRAVDVRFSYGDRTVIAPSSFDVPNGAITAVIGPNGSGKSTLLNGLAGLHAPAAGTLEHGTNGRPARIAYVLQSTKVNESLPITAREVVAMGRYPGKGGYRPLTRPDHEAIERAMARMGISDLAHRHLSELSGGQRQRVFVAQGLAQEHDLLLLDEPLTGLDLVSAQAIDDVIHDEHDRGCTVVMTTHDLHEARVADHVLLLSGRVVASGPPDEVLTMDNLAVAYGPSLLHIDGGRLFLDDPHHHPAGDDHRHERSIHIESSQTDSHEGPR